MSKNFLLAFFLISFSLTVSADWQVGGGYTDFSEKIQFSDVSLGIIYGSVSYQFTNTENKVSYIPELKIGSGVSNDSASGVDLEVKRLIVLSVRAQYDYGNGAYIYAVPSYANLDIKATFQEVSASDDNWEFGYGAGIGYYITDKSSVEASFETFDETDVITLGVKYSF